MISRLEIKGFKSLVDVSIELGAVNVFIGANGSGKSNLLEAVGFLSAIISGGLEEESIRYRGVRLGIPSSFRTSFKDKIQRPLSIATADDQVRYSVEFAPNENHPSDWSLDNEILKYNEVEVISGKLDKFEILGKERFLYKKFYDYKLRSKSLMKYLDMALNFMVDDRERGLEQPYLSRLKDSDLSSDRLSKFFDQISKYGIYTPGTPELRGSGYDIHRDPLGLGGWRLDQAINDMLRIEPDKLGPFDLDDVYELIDWADSLHTESNAKTNASIMGEPVRLRIGDRFMGTTHKSVSLIEASEGALYVLFMLALVGHEQSPKLFAVDNFDQALHPRLARALTQLVSEQIVDDGSRQMLATTHNPLVLDGLDLLDDRIRLFTVDRDSSGASQVSRVQVTPELMAQAENGFSLSRLWNMGRLGGVPKFL
jgi:predicted ATPase